MALTGGRDIMWAPWRMAYVAKGSDAVGRACPFCALPALGDDRAALILSRARGCYTLMNRYPYNNGHLMIVPDAHVERLDALPDDVLAEIMLEARRAQAVLAERMRPQGFNLGLNLGVAAGAGIADHLHLHVVPRWSGDTNFMPVLGDTRVMPQHLEETYDLLVEGFAR